MIPRIGPYIDDIFGDDPDAPVLVLVKVTPGIGDAAPTTANHTLRGWCESFGTYLVVGGLVGKGMRQVCVTGESVREVGVEPRAKDKLTIDGVSYLIDSASADAEKALWTLIVSGPG